MRRTQFPGHVLLWSIILAACVDTSPTGLARDARPLPQMAVAHSFNGLVRIGVVPTTNAVTLGSAGSYTIARKTTGAVLLSGTNSAVTVTLGSPSIVKWRVQVICSSGATLAFWQTKATDLGYPVNLEPVPTAGCTRLHIGDFDLSVPFAIRNAFRLRLLADGFPSDLFPVTRTISTATYRIVMGATDLTVSEAPVVTSASALVRINGVTYRGRGEVVVNSAGTLAGVNELPMEEYLYGVVPLELGPIAYPEFEAQKAQAVAARTFALAGLGRRAANGYDLLATTADQVYGGYGAEHAISTAAVNDTRGVVLTYNGALISANYSSASGGHTADNEESFDGAPAAYLRGIADAERGVATEYVPSLEVFRAHGNAASLRALREGDYESNWSRFHRWTFEWTMAEISSVISAFATQPVGDVLAINVLHRGPSGRVLEIEYVTEAGTFTDRKDRIRSSLRTVNAAGTATNLPSTLFFIEPVTNRATGEVSGYRVYGGGFGHGVGLAQTGAVGMAEKKHTFDEILRHYYRGVDLTVAY